MPTNRNSGLVELQSLFRVEHGNKFDRNKMTVRPPGGDAIAFVGRSGTRNGVVAFVDKMTGREPYPRGLITVALGGAALSSFVQPWPFYTAQNIDVLYPIDSMSLDEKLYYCLCIEANRFRYSTFGREANRTLKNLMLPRRESLPEWVNGSGRQALADLTRDLAAIAGY